MESTPRTNNSNNNKTQTPSNPCSFNNQNTKKKPKK